MPSAPARFDPLGSPETAEGHRRRGLAMKADRDETQTGDMPMRFLLGTACFTIAVLRQPR
jgi:hypothetical protein